MNAFSISIDTPIPLSLVLVIRHAITINGINIEMICHNSVVYRYKSDIQKFWKNQQQQQKFSDRFESYLVKMKL